MSSFEFVCWLNWKPNADICVTYKFYTNSNLQAIVLFVCVVAGSPVEHDNVHAEVVRSEISVEPESFNYNYETSNGIAAKSSGQLKQVGEESGVVQQGDFSYTGDDGKRYAVSFVADENG